MPHLDVDFVLPAQAAAAAATTSTKDVQALQAQLDSQRANSARECRAACRVACQASRQAATCAQAEARRLRAEAAWREAEARQMGATLTEREARLTAAKSDLGKMRKVSAALLASAHAAPACKLTSS